ncbi:MAG: hypothetical protein IJ776_05965, partial [Paludibacteraceae bacterium]|nr:hypothetical protein [Paludibacteraceae bacterium]MBR1808913.1 hypothetical protein [Paludibacteraceae bacterium]
GPTLTWHRTADGTEIRSSVRQMVQVYTLQGIQVAERMMNAGEPMLLPKGMYIIRGEQETGKAF